MDYQEAWNMQRALAREVTEGRRGGTLLLLEHPSTYTLGRRSKEEHLLLPRVALEALGARVVEVDRGGEATFHGPGQLVGYPILDLGAWGGPLRYVRALEGALIATLAEYRVTAGRIEGLTGVWVGGEKIAAIGVRVSQGVTTHGFALNVATDLGWFQHIVPCGIRDRGVTSMQRVLGRAPSLGEVAEVVANRLGQEMGMEMVGGATL
ncbi:MAG: lipoyl(octanoyl) transferase LipB [Chloroflexi bacterium]|nr:lipoyl(octanoyl) transferase LipB [Chloroflexota bacterium]